MGGFCHSLPHHLPFRSIILPHNLSSPNQMSSPNPFISSPASSGYATVECFSSPPSINLGRAEPLYGDEVSPPHLSHDEFAIVNLDFWDHDVDKDKFSGWMRMTEVSVFLFPSYGMLLIILLIPFSGSRSVWLFLLGPPSGLLLVNTMITSTCGRRFTRTLLTN